MKYNFGKGSITSPLGVESIFPTVLGHGQYKFKHTFSEIPELTEGTTTPKNLEDYAPGSYLFKYQWDQIHFPLQDEFVCLDVDEEGQYTKGKILTLLEFIKKTYKDNSTLQYNLKESLNTEKIYFKNMKSTFSFTIIKNKLDNIEISPNKNFTTFNTLFKRHEVEFYDNKKVLQFTLRITGMNEEQAYIFDNWMWGEDKDEFGIVSDIQASIAPDEDPIAPSNGSTNFKGGTFGCTRVYPASNSKSESPNAARCNYEKASSGGYYRYHSGIDVSLPFGTEIKAILGGEVAVVPVKNDNDKSGLGSNIVIKSKTKSGKIIYYHYAHLLASSLILNNGDPVKRGQVIGISGKTGNIATISGIESNIVQQHCHIEVYEGDNSYPDKNKRVNPKNYVNKFLKQRIEEYD